MLRAVTAGLLCVCAGIGHARKLTARADELRGWHRALEEMHAACTCLRLPPEKIWQSTAQRDGKDLPAQTLTKEEGEMLSACRQRLFQGTAAQQEMELRYVIGRFSKALSEAEEKRNKDAGMYGMLGVLGGLCVFLMCI